MGKFFNKIPDHLRDWALKQPMFWIASAPLQGHHVNVSPKGMPSATFTIFDQNHCAYLDVTGSGSETIAHIYENGRATLCWCSFDTTPRILRFYCRGKVIEHDDSKFEPLLRQMGHPRLQGARAIIYLEVWKVGTSCGKSVPLLEREQSLEEEGSNDSSAVMATTASRHFKQRDTLTKWATTMEIKDKMLNYRRDKNSESLDGLPGIRAARKKLASPLWIGDVQHTTSLAFKEVRGICLGILLTFIFIFGCQRSSDWHSHLNNLLRTAESVTQNW